MRNEGAILIYIKIEKNATALTFTQVILRCLGSSLISEMKLFREKQLLYVTYKLVCLLPSGHSVKSFWWPKLMCILQCMIFVLAQKRGTKRDKRNNIFQIKVKISEQIPH